jgi:hypothetical protein
MHMTLPDLGANPLQVAFQDYQRMEQELAIAREECAAKSAMVNDLLRENEFLRRNYDKAVAERDRYQALAVNLATRAVCVRDSVDRLLSEAVSARAAPSEQKAADGDSLAAELADVMTASGAIGPDGKRGEVLRLEPGVVKRDITGRTTALAPNEFL